MSQNTVQARSAIEALRSGVPSRFAVLKLGTNQSAIEERFRTALDTVEAGGATEPIVIASDFGTGKTHLLEYLQVTAEDRGFVTAYLVVSPALRLGDPRNTLKAIAENALAPKRTGKALRELTTDRKTDTPEFARLRLWARDNQLPQWLQAVVHLYEETSQDTEFRTRLLRDIEGIPLSTGDLKKRLKDIGQAGAYDLKGTKHSQIAHDRILLLAQFFRMLTMRGLVVLFDELERLTSFPRKARLQAYSELAWWNEVAATPGSGILPVFTMTTPFLKNTVKPDTKVLPRRATESQGAGILKNALNIARLSQEDLSAVKEKVRTLYADAYGTLPMDQEGQTETFARQIRMSIRKWITIWDLQRYEPTYQPHIVSEALPEDTTTLSFDELGDVDDSDTEEE